MVVITVGTLLYDGEDVIGDAVFRFSMFVYGLDDDGVLYGRLKSVVPLGGLITLLFNCRLCFATNWTFRGENILGP